MRPGWRSAALLLCICLFFPSLPMANATTDPCPFSATPSFFQRGPLLPLSFYRRLFLLLFIFSKDSTSHAVESTVELRSASFGWFVGGVCCFGLGAESFFSPLFSFPNFPATILDCFAGGRRGGSIKGFDAFYSLSIPCRLGSFSILSMLPLGFNARLRVSAASTLFAPLFPRDFSPPLDFTRSYCKPCVSLNRSVLRNADFLPFFPCFWVISISMNVRHPLTPSTCVFTIADKHRLLLPASRVALSCSFLAFPPQHWIAFLTRPHVLQTRAAYLQAPLEIPPPFLLPRDFSNLPGVLRQSFLSFPPLTRAPSRLTPPSFGLHFSMADGFFPSFFATAVFYPRLEELYHSIFPPPF